jgi:MSHA biogenesis protein MshL
LKTYRLGWKPALLASLMASGCASPTKSPSTPAPISRGHLVEDASPTPTPAQASTQKSNDALTIPPVAAGAPRLPAPRVVKPQETYSVVVNNVNVQTLLFALARDAKLNLDVHPGITGMVTLNALDQTIYELLDRIARQVDMRYELEGKNLFVLPDAPFLRLYKVDYLNITRESSSSTGSESLGSTGGNSSATSIRNVSNNRFWTTLTENIRDLLRETDKVIATTNAAASTAPAAVAAPPAAPTSLGALGASTPRTATTNAAVAPAPAAATSLFREAAAVIANPETGVISVRATGKQHARVREFLDQIVGNARRQVLIEATIVEVALTKDYQQGINWSLIRNSINGGDTAVSLVQAPGGGSALLSGASQAFLGAFGLTRSRGRTDIGATVRLLESFGKTKVLSSPKVSVMNNQSALLKVVDNKIYFTISVTPGTAATLSSPATAAVYNTLINTVPVGFLMNVTAQIGDDDEVTLNLRPTVSRITSYVTDPNPALAPFSITNRIPEIQTREFESIMKVRDGETAVLGGLMQDASAEATDQVPGIGDVPIVGDLLKYRSNQSSKSELVIFLRPTIMRDASINGDASFIRGQLSADTPVPSGRRP